MKVYKAILNNQRGKQKIKLPINHSILSIGVQGNDDLAVWYTDDTNSDFMDFEFSLIHTGDDIPDYSQFVGTFLLYNGTYILHLFKHVDID